LVGQATAKVKGNVSRSLAAKASLAVRIDALANQHDEEMGEEEDKCKLGVEFKQKVELRLKHLENNLLEGGNKKKFNTPKDSNDLKRKRDDTKDDQPRKFKRD